MGNADPALSCDLKHHDREPSGCTDIFRSNHFEETLLFLQYLNERVTNVPRTSVGRTLNGLIEFRKTKWHRRTGQIGGIKESGG